MSSNVTPELLTVAEVQHLLRISRSSVYRLCAEHRLSHVKIGDSRRIPLASALAFIEANTIAAKAS